MRIILGFIFCAVWALAQRVTILATTDLHGNLLPYDYYTSRPAERGLAKIATLIHATRKEKSQQPADRLRRYHPGFAARIRASA